MTENDSYEPNLISAYDALQQAEKIITEALSCSLRKFYVSKMVFQIIRELLSPPVVFCGQDDILNSIDRWILLYPTFGIDKQELLKVQKWVQDALTPAEGGYDFLQHHSASHQENRCLMCGTDMGPENPRQLCGHWRCDNEAWV